MPQVMLIEPPGSARDALAYALHALKLSVQVRDDARQLAEEYQADTRLLIVAEAALGSLAGQADWLRAHPCPLWVLLEPGSFQGLIRALRVGAAELIHSDRLPSDIAALARAELRSPAVAAPHPDTGGITIELEREQESFQLPPDRVIALLAQMCDEVGRLKRRYDAELQQRQRVELALMESEAFYQSLVETLPLALFRKDLDGRVTFANQRFCDVLSRRPTDILGRTDYDFFPRAMAEKYRADDRRVMESRENLEAIEEFQTPTGDQRFNHVVKTPVFDNNGQLVGIQGVFSDVTDRMLTENALEQERYLLDSLMHNSPDNIYFKDLQGRYIRINPAKARRSGLMDPTDAIGRSDFDFFPAAHAQAALSDELRVLQTGQPLLSKEELISYADGSHAWMSTTKLPLRDRQGRVIGTFGVSHDITALKEAQHALRQAAAAADAANRAKSDFLANMSHEIRTPLNAVLGMTELVLGTPLSPVQRDYLKLVHESGESLLAVINDILDFSKIEAGKFQLDAITFELREFLGDTLKSLGLRAHRKGLELACEVDPLVPDLLVGDANRVRQIIVNLVGNAIKFTEQGEVVVHVTLDPTQSCVPTSSPETESASNETVCLLVEVSDTGIGIPLEKFHTIFQAFEQADASTTRRFGGTGLGLAISSRLVELMGGRIWVESEVGHGSTFHFTASFRRTSKPPRPPVSASPELLQGLRVLVVDDNSTNRRILAEMLASWGMQPILACSAAEALQLLRNVAPSEPPFSLVVTDVNMPELSGFDMVDRARAAGSLNCGIIVMLTSGDRSEDLQSCARLGVDTYLIKPVKQSELFNAILLALGARHADDWKSAVAGTQRTSERPLRVLLAEDSHINQKLAVGLLERWGHSVDVADNGNQAVAKVQHQLYDVVLMDVQMPELDGFDATRAIRDWERQTGMPPLPIIAMTAHALPGDRERCLAAGMDDYLSKPIRSEVLFQTLEQLNQHVPLGVAKAIFPNFSAAVPNAAENLDAIRMPAEQHDPDLPLSSHATQPPHPAQPIQTTTLPSHGATDAATSVSPALIDWTAARNAMANDEGLVRDVALAFCEECPQLLTQLQAAIVEQNSVVAQRCLHTLKNSLNMFGATAAAQMAYALENETRQSQTVPPLAACRPVAEAILAVKAELQQYLNDNTGDRFV